MKKTTAHSLLQSGRVSELLKSDYFVSELSSRVATRVLGLVTEEQLSLLSSGEAHTDKELFQDIFSFLIALEWREGEGASEDSHIRRAYSSYVNGTFDSLGRVLEHILAYQFSTMVYLAPGEFDKLWVDVFFVHEEKRYAVQVKHCRTCNMWPVKMELVKNKKKVQACAPEFGSEFTPDGYLGVHFRIPYLPCGVWDNNSAPSKNLSTPQRVVENLPAYLAWDGWVVEVFGELLPIILNLINEKSETSPHPRITVKPRGTSEFAEHRIKNPEGTNLVTIYDFDIQ